MIAVEIAQPGPPEVLRAAQRKVPEPGVGELLIRVAAAGVNRADVLQRRGLYPPPAGASDIPGLEVAGVVVRLDPAVRGIAVGARVLVTAGSERKCAACRELGADEAFNYREVDFVEATRRATGGRGADVILDMVGGDYPGRDLAAASVEGRIAVIATQGGARAQIDLGLLLGKRLTITGSTLRPQPVENKGRLAATLREKVWPLFGSRRLKPVIHARFPLGDAAGAHRLMESDVHIGKIILTV